MLLTGMLPTDDLATIVRTIKKNKLYMGCTFLIDLVPNYHPKNAIKISKLSSQVNIGSEGFQNIHNSSNAPQRKSKQIIFQATNAVIFTANKSGRREHIIADIMSMQIVMKTRTRNSTQLWFPDDPVFSNKRSSSVFQRKSNA